MTTDQDAFEFQGFGDGSDDAGTFTLDELEIADDAIDFDQGKEEEEDTGEEPEPETPDVDEGEQGQEEDEVETTEGGDSEEEEEQGEGAEGDEDLPVALEILRSMGLGAAIEGEAAPKTMEEVEAIVADGEITLFTNLRKSIGGVAGELLDLAVKLRGKVPEENIAEAIARNFDQIKVDSAIDSDAKRVSYLKEAYKARGLSESDAEALITTAKSQGKLAEKVSDFQRAQREQTELQKAEQTRVRQARVTEAIQSADWKDDHKKSVAANFANGTTGRRLNAVLRNPAGLAQLASLLEDVDEEGNFGKSAGKRTPKESKATVSAIRRAMRSRGTGKTKQGKRDVIKRGQELEFEIT